MMLSLPGAVCLWWEVDIEVTLPVISPWMRGWIQAWTRKLSFLWGAVIGVLEKAGEQRLGVEDSSIHSVPQSGVRSLVLTAWITPVPFPKDLFFSFQPLQLPSHPTPPPWNTHRSLSSKEIHFVPRHSISGKPQQLGGMASFSWNQFLKLSGLDSI